MIVLEKMYDGESISDIERDVFQMFNEEYDPMIETIPRDEHGFMKGTFRVKVEWIPE